MAGREINLDLLDSVTAATLGEYVIGGLEDRTLQVERLLLELVRPDPVQPRRVLPDRIYHAFHNNKLTPAQSLREIVQTAQLAARHRGRPFDGLLELLPNPDTEDDSDATALSPEERLLQGLVNLAVTIRDDGQVNPLTVVNMSEGATQLYRIETGERRYWATWLARNFLPGYGGDGMIPCIIISSDVASTFRQAKENTARSGLSAIAMARQAALLLLTVHGHEMPTHAVDNDFYRQALDLTLRGKREHTTDILAAMGGISRMRLSQIKALLNLSDEALELADRHDLDEWRLRHVLNLPQEEHVEMVRQIIEFNLNGRQIKEICEQESIESAPNDNEPVPRHTKRFIRLLKAANMGTAQDLAQALIVEEKNVHLARARLRSLMEFLNETQKYLSEE